MINIGDSKESCDKTYSKIIKVFKFFDCVFTGIVFFLIALVSSFILLYNLIKLNFMYNGYLILVVVLSIMIGIYCLRVIKFLYLYLLELITFLGLFVGILSFVLGIASYENSYISMLNIFVPYLELVESEEIQTFNFITYLDIDKDIDNIETYTIQLKNIKDKSLRDVEVTERILSIELKEAYHKGKVELTFHTQDLEPGEYIMLNDIIYKDGLYVGLESKER